MNRRDLLKLAAALPATPLMFADDPVQNSSQGSKTPRKVKKRPETGAEPRIGQILPYGPKTWFVWNGKEWKPIDMTKARVKWT